MWDPGDKNAFLGDAAKNIGQININNQIGKLLYHIAKSDSNSNFLEIGTWNGLGSTKCIVEGLIARKTPYKFYSLECNSEKRDLASKYYSSYPDVQILSEVLLNEMPNDIYEIFPELKDSPTFQYWNKVDFDNMKDKPLFLKRESLPQIFDLVLLDGGEFTTWYEYLQIKDRCKYLALDDTKASKCKRIREEILTDSNWTVLLDSDERNGTMVAIKSIW
jgi:hypothetical protein